MIRPILHLLALGGLCARAFAAPAPIGPAVVMLDKGPGRTLTHARSVGLNFEMALTSDRMWQADGRWMERSFRELGIKTLRWGYSAIWWDAFAEKPLATQYWCAANSHDAAGTFGFKEFVAYCKRTGTTPSIMLPVDALALDVPMERVADLSRRIAEYVRDQKLATPVYLEMGNEPYSNPKLAPERYAAALRQLYPMLKAIDPRFLVVAQVDRTLQPFITEPCVDFYDVIQWHHYLTCGGKGVDSWDWYYAQHSSDLARLNEGDQVIVPPGKGYVIGEINVLWPDWSAPMAGDLRSSLVYLDLLLCTINADRADAILPWPSHWPAHNGAPAYGLFDYDTFTSKGTTRVFPSVAGAHRILKEAVLDQVVSAQCEDPKVRVFAYASRDNSRRSLVLINKRPEPRVVRIPFSAGAAVTEAWSLDATASGPAYRRLDAPQPQAGFVVITLPAESAVFLCSAQAVASSARAPSVLTPAFSAPENVREAKLLVPATPVVWEGWGTSLCWMGKTFGERDDLADLFFSSKTVTLPEFPNQPLPGLGLNVVRYNAGASSSRPVNDEQMMVPPKTVEYRQIDAYWLDPARPDPASSGWDWNADAAQRAMLLKARDRGANRFELFSNSPPWWMLTNRNPSGAPDKAVNLDRNRHADFAYYLATIARRARDKWGVAFTSIDPFNEPSSGYWKGDGKQEGSNLPPAVQSQIIPLLRAELDRQGLKDLPLSASDETSYSQALSTWKELSPEARSVVAQVNVHGYQHRKGPRAELAVAVSAEKKRLWNSEYGDNQPDGLELAHNLHLDFAQLRAQAWCYWQPLDVSLGWSFVQFDAASRRLLAITPKLYVMAHYSRHIHPGMKILASSDPAILAAADADSGHLVVVALNEGPARELRLDCSAVTTASGTVARWLTEPRDRTRYSPQPALLLEHGRLVCSLPADSVQTFELGARP